MKDLEALQRLHKCLVLYVQSAIDVHTVPDEPDGNLSNMITFPALKFKDCEDKIHHSIEFFYVRNIRQIELRLRKGTFICSLFPFFPTNNSDGIPLEPEEYNIQLLYKKYYIFREEGSVQFALTKGYDYDEVLSIDEVQYINQDSDSIFQCSTMIPDYEEMYHMFKYCILESLLCSIEPDIIYQLGLSLEKECKKLGIL